MTFEVAGSQIVERQRALSQMAAGKRGFNPGLAGQQPVHSRVEIVLAQSAHLEFLPQAVMAGLRPERARGGELGSGFENTCGNQGKCTITIAAGFGIKDRPQIQVVDRGKHGGDMAVRKRAGESLSHKFDCSDFGPEKSMACIRLILLVGSGLNTRPPAPK